MKLHLFFTPNFGSDSWQHEAFETDAAFDARYQELRRLEQAGEIEDLAVKFYLFHHGEDEAVAVRDVLDYLNRYDLCEMGLPQKMEQQEDRLYFRRRLATLAGPQVMLKSGQMRYWLPAVENNELAGQIRHLLESTQDQPLTTEDQLPAGPVIHLLFHDHRRIQAFTLTKGHLRSEGRQRMWQTDLCERVMHWMANGLTISAQD